MYWFVAYREENKETGEVWHHQEIIRDIHPVIWYASSYSPESRMWNSSLIFFAEVPKEVVENAEVHKMLGWSLGTIYKMTDY